jgi:hypothetical protein
MQIRFTAIQLVKTHFEVSSREFVAFACHMRIPGTPIPYHCGTGAMRSTVPGHSGQFLSPSVSLIPLEVNYIEEVLTVVFHR